jgi:hypothetical protein
MTSFTLAFIKGRLRLGRSQSSQALLKAKAADRPVLVSREQNKKEFGLA